MSAEELPIIFYDGNCSFCNSSVQFVLNKRRKDFNFIALQSAMAKEILEAFDIDIQLDTLYLLIENKVHNRSSAALQITRRLRGVYRALYCFYIIPKPIRDWVYRLIANRRHIIKAGFCVVPKQDEKKFFLD